MLDMPDIERDLAQLFITSARCGSFNQAARILNTHSTVIRRRLAKLESYIGSPLFSYRERTLSLTDSGRALYELLDSRFGDLHPVPHPGPKELMRLACPDALLSTVLARQLVAFIRRYAAMRLEIQPMNGLPVEPAEVMIWMGEPDAPRPSPNFAMTKPKLLGRVGYCPHVAKRYSGGQRPPVNPDDLRNYMLVQHINNTSRQAFGPWNKLVHQRQSSVTVVHSQELVHELVKSSACVGLLPDFISRLDRTLLPLHSLFDTTMERCVWMSTTPLAAQRDEVQEMASLVISAFEDRRNWLDDDRQA